jgi:hypothetical protein
MPTISSPIEAMMTISIQPMAIMIVLSTPDV